MQISIEKRIKQEHEIIVRFLSQNDIQQYMNIGRKWFVYDGDLEIGEGEFIEVKMPKNDKQRIYLSKRDRLNLVFYAKRVYCFDSNLLKIKPLNKYEKNT